MNEIIKIGGKLAAICAIAAISLGVVNAITDPVIVAARAARLQNALEKLSGGLDIGEFSENKDSGSVTGYYPLSGNSGIEAYIVKVVGSGYGGDMNILTGISSKGEILSVVLMENAETPGLGKEAENASYMTKYIGTGNGSAIPSNKTQLSSADSDAVTGASITFMAIGKALNNAADFVLKMEGM